MSGNEKDMFFEDEVWKHKDPESGAVRIYNAETGEWVAEEEKNSAAGKSDDNLSQEYVKNVGGVWVHRDPATKILSTFSEEKQEWVPIAEEEEPEKEAEADDDMEDEVAFQLAQEREERKAKLKEIKDAKARGISMYRDPKTQILYEFDEFRRDWFPVVNDEFIAQYQASYGVDQPQTSKDEEKLPEKEEKGKGKRKGEPEKMEWYQLEDENNRNIYLSNLPLDITEAEMQELVAKCGLVAQDPRTKKFKIKLYKDEEGNLKGDGLCCYIKRESVELALKILDGCLCKGKEIKVEAAKFQMKGEGFDPSKKKRKLTKREKKEFLERQERLFDWRPDKSRTERPKSDCTVVLKNAFTVEEIVKDASLLLEIQNGLETECAKYGEIKKVVVYPSNPEGVATVSYKAPNMSDDCITMMDYRIFRGRKLRASIWDGTTKYKAEESEELRKMRDKNWEKFLVSDS